MLLPRLGARASVAIAAGMVVAGVLIAAVVVRGVLATLSIRTWRGTTPQVLRVPHPPSPPPK